MNRREALKAALASGAALAIPRLPGLDVLPLPDPAGIAPLSLKVRKMSTEILVPYELLQDSKVDLTKVLAAYERRHFYAV